MPRLSLSLAALVSLLTFTACIDSGPPADVLYKQGYAMQISSQRMEALQYYRDAADKGHALAMIALGVMDDGGTVHPNLTLALLDSTRGNSDWYTDAIPALEQRVAAGDEPSRILLAIMYERGFGGQRAPERAVNLLQAAPPSAVRDYWLGWAFEDHGQYEAAARFYQSASRAGVPAAYTALGLMHMHGKGVHANFGTGMALLRVGFDRGHTDAGPLYSSLLTTTERGAARGSTRSQMQLEEYRRTGLRDMQPTSSF